MLWTGERACLSDIEEEEGLRRRERAVENGGVMRETETDREVRKRIFVCE